MENDHDPMNDDAVAPPGSELHRQLAPTRVPGFWHQIVASLVDGICVVTPDGAIIEANPAFCRMVGFERSEILGQRPPFAFWPLDELATIEPVFGAALEGRSADFELTLCRKNGERFPSIVHPNPIRDDRGVISCVYATIEDISRRKDLELTLRRSEERWQSIAENPYDFVCIIGADYKYQYVNHTAEGLTREDLIGKKTPFDYVEPAFHEPMRNAFERTLRTGQATTYDLYVEILGRWFSNIVGPLKTDGVVTALSILTRDVTDAKTAEFALQQSEHRLQLAMAGGDVGVFDIDIGKSKAYYSSRLAEILGFEIDPTADLDARLGAFGAHLHPFDRDRTLLQLRTAMTGDEPFDCEYRVGSVEKGYRWVHSRGRSLAGPNGALHFSGCVTDVTRRKRTEAEREQLEGQLRQLQKMDTLGRLSAGLAHDFNNMLVPILGNAELILGEAGMDSPFRSGLEDIIQASTRARELAGRILVFGRHSDEPARPTNVPNIVRETVRFLRASAPRDVEIIERIDAKCPEIMGTAGQIHQAVTNLCTNAYQALKGRTGRIIVEVAPVQIDAAFAQRYRMEEGTALRVVVEDDGPGMPKEVLDRAFEPFFTTKPPGEGSGLGLSLVHGIVRQHQGAIVTESAPNRGARFELYFPLQGPTAARYAADDEGSVPPISSMRRRILCVDDEATVLRVISQVLSRAGHIVTAVHSAHDALIKLRDAPADFDVVVTDQTMPELTGLELAVQVHELRRDLPIILLSGYAESSLTANAPPNVRLCLQKPLTARALLQAVERAVGT